MDNYMFEGGRITKMEVDYTPACDEKIPIAKELAKTNPDAFHEAIEILLQLEKQARLGADMVSCSRVLVAICQICYDCGNWNALNEYISLLVRRRSQLKQAVSKMIQECVQYVDKTPDKETKLKLIDTLRSVTEGKIYVEIERARLTKILADIKEADGDIAGAAAIMEQLQVETYGSMDKREKVELILEQMRLCLLKEDFVSTQIIAKKISIKFFDDPRQQDLKMKFYDLMIHLDRGTSFLKTSRHYQAIASGANAQPVSAAAAATKAKDAKKKITADAAAAANAAAAAAMEKGTKLLKKSTKTDAEEKKIATAVAAATKSVTTIKETSKGSEDGNETIETATEAAAQMSSNDDDDDEVAMITESIEPAIPPLTEEEKRNYREKLICAVIYCVLAPFDNEQSDMMEHLSRNKKLEEVPVYKEILRLFMSKELINFDAFNSEYGGILNENEIFKENTAHGQKCAEELKDRLIEHNIRIIANYYSRIHLKRISELLNLPSSKCEIYLSKLANNDTIRVKIDRPAEIIYFTTKKTPSDILNSWAQDTNMLMSLVNKTCHLINKEECINSVLGSTATAAPIIVSAPIADE